MISPFVVGFASESASAVDVGGDVSRNITAVETISVVSIAFGIIVVEAAKVMIVSTFLTVEIAFKPGVG